MTIDEVQNRLLALEARLCLVTGTPFGPFTDEDLRENALEISRRGKVSSADAERMLIERMRAGTLQWR